MKTTRIDNMPCCPTPSANVVTVQNVDGLKKLTNTFVYVQSINTSFYVDNAHRITWISSGCVEKANYDLQANPLNLRNQFLYDPDKKEVHYFSNTGYAATFFSSASLDDLEKLEQQIALNSKEIKNLNIGLNTTNIKVGNIEEELDTITGNVGNLQIGLETETTNREAADQELQNKTASNTEKITVIKTNLDQEVEQSTEFTSDASTVTVEHSKVNLSNSTTNTVSEVLPVASTTEAGVINAPTFQSIQNTAESVDSILNGAVAIEDLPANPTQEELTEQWKTQTGNNNLMNRASIFDVTNQKLFYYYENVGTWYSVGASGEGGGTVTVSGFTNDTAGTIKGSTNPGQIFAEPDNTGSVNGWDSTQENISNLTEGLGNLEEKVDGLEIPKLPLAVIGGTNTSKESVYAPLYTSISNNKPQLNWHIYDTSTGEMTNASSWQPGDATASQSGWMAGADKSKLDSLATITSIGENLELTDEGVLNATGGGGGSGATPLTAYDSSATDSDVYSAKYINNRLNASSISIGYSVSTSGLYAIALGANSSSKARGVAIGGTSKVTVGNGVSIGYGASGEAESVAIGCNTECIGWNSIAIGSTAQVNENAENGIAIGYGANSQSTEGLALGLNAVAAHSQSIALGDTAKTTRNREVAINRTLANGTVQTRFLSGVTAGTQDTDAVNVKQLNDAIAALQSQINLLKSGSTY